MRDFVAIPTQSGWREDYVAKLKWTDALIILGSLLAAQLGRFGLDSAGLKFGSYDLSYWILGVLIGGAWWIMLGAWDSRKIRFVGSGTDEFKLVTTATLWLFGTIALLSFAFELQTARGYILLALPLGTICILFSRLMQRRALHRLRRLGQSSAPVLVVASPNTAAHLVRSLSREPSSGFLPIAIHLPGTSNNTATNLDDLGAPVFGTGSDVQSILDSISNNNIDTVALSSGVRMDPKVIRDLGWALADRRIRLIMTPALTDVAGPRIHVQPVAGLPLVHVSTPQFSSGAHFAKRIFDIIFSVILIVVLSPVLLCLTTIVKLGGGPTLFRQRRVGHQGRPFEMLKFRSMVVDAEAQAINLSEQSDGNGIMFKMKDDPRVTATGKWMRRFSLDELPQLFNVLIGNMSLVGPRPPLESEVENYEDHVHRRFMVKPGITGLWQVSGRSDLSWSDTVRLDLYYVENWSFAGDMIILFKTFKAVIKVDGAY